MGDNKGSNIFTTITIHIIFGLAGYFVYDGFAGMFGMILISIILCFTALLGFIPIVGNIIQYFLMKYIMTKMLIMTGLFATTLTGIIFWFYILLGFITSTVVIFIILAMIIKEM